MGYEPTTPEGTFYVLARSPIEDDTAFVARLADDDVFVLPGSTINLPGWFRISLTASDEMIEASIERFARGERSGCPPDRYPAAASSRLRIASAAIVMYSWSRALASPGASDASIASRMWTSQRSRSRAPIENGKCRARSRGWPRSSEVRRRAAPVLDEEQREPPPGAHEVRLVRVERQQDVVRLDAVVEPVHQPVEERQPAHLLVEGRLRHGPECREDGEERRGPPARPRPVHRPIRALDLQSAS